jgi:hypothetical protein
MILSLDYLSGKLVNILTAFEEDRKAVISVKDGSIRASFERARLARLQGGLESLGREVTKDLQLGRIQSVF